MLTVKDDKIHNLKAMQQEQNRRLFLKENINANQWLMLQQQAIRIAEQRELLRTATEDIIEIKDQLQETRIALKRTMDYQRAFTRTNRN